MPLLQRSVGSRESLCIEFEVNSDLDAPVNTWWGRIALWVAGNLVGDNSEVEMVSLGVGILLSAALQTGSRRNDVLSSLSPGEALDLVMWAVYGEENPRFRELVGSTDLSMFEVLPRGGPFFDDWQAILLEEHEQERFICRKEGASPFEVTWPIGTFKHVVFQAVSELKRLQTLPPDGTIH